jgi:hypothetical protein
VELVDWIIGDLTSLRQRIGSGFIDQVPAIRWTETVDGGGVAPLYVAWHTARHHDVAVNGVVRSTPQVLDAWSDRVGVHRDTWRGLAEGEDHDLVAALDPTMVGGYLLAVLDTSIEWLTAEPLPDLTRVPDAAAALASMGTPKDRFDWLYAMWGDKPVQFFLSWEAIGHGYNHLGELLSLRNRMGLGRF